MKIKNLLLIIPFILVSLFLTSCFPEDELAYSGPAVVEFKNHTLGMGNAVLTARGIVTQAGTQTDSTRTVLLNVRTTDTIYVQLVGPHQSQAINLDYSVRASSTAVEGTHYNFAVANTRQVTIPANSSIGYILINPVANSLPAVGDQVRIDIDLLGNSSFPTSVKYDVFKVTLRR